MISTCNNNGTVSDPSDDTFTADITVIFDTPPATGTLDLTGDSGVISVLVSDLITSTSHTFSGVSMIADGTSIDITATFSDDVTCSFNEPVAGLAPASCSPDCEITNITVSNISTCSDAGTPVNPDDDTYTADITVTYSNPPSSGDIILTGDTTTSISVAAASIGATSYTFQNVTMPADGGPIDATVAFSGGASTCTLSVSTGTAPASCSPDCEITNITVSDISVCSNNGTQGDPSDDTYTADITVTYSNPPTSGNIVLSGDGSRTETISIGSTSHTFQDVTMPADGGPIDTTVTFSGGTSTCTLSVSTGNAPASCSPECIITNITADNISICNDGGTQGSGQGGDDTFTADITVTYDFVPASGTLDLTGDLLTPTAVGVGGLDSPTSHTFVGVQFTSDGGPVNLSADFSDAFTSCIFNNSNVFTAQSQCSEPVGNGGLALNKSHCDWGYTTNDTYIIRYSGSLVNNGTDPVYNVSIIDDLGGAFGNDAFIDGFISRSVGPNIDGWSLNAGFNGTTDEELLSTTVLNELAPGESITYGFCVEVTADPSLDGTSITNTIVATANNSVNGEAYTISATDVETFEENLSILSAGLEVDDATPSVNTDGTVDFFYTITLRNSGSGIASDVQYVDSFDHLFSNGIPINTLTVTQLSGTLNPNPDFDGGSGIIGTSTDLLVSGQTMAPNATASFRVDLNVGPTGNQTTRNTQGVFSGTDANGITVSDTSRRNLTALHDEEQCFCEQTPVRIQFVPIPIVTKTIINNDPAGTLGNRDITFQIEIENDPTSPVDLFNLQVVDDIEAMCPGNIVSVGAPQITTSTATVDPVLNTFYTGQGLNNIFENNTGQFAPGERLILTIDVEIALPCTGDNVATFTATDPNGTVLAPVTSSVSINNPPEADDDTDTTNVDTPITIDPLSNDTDPDLDSIIISEVDGIEITEGGAPVVLSDGTIVQYISGELLITPPSGSNAPISFPYTVQDPLGNEDTANIFININTCSITTITLSNISACNSGGTTGDSTDDTFTADVTINYTNPPGENPVGSGHLILSGDATASVSVTALDSATSHTFTNVTFSADGGPVDLIAEFDNPNGCSISQTAGTAPDSCSIAVADIGVTKTLNESGPFQPGDTVSWTVVVSNLGTDTATNVILSDTPTNVTITNISGGGCTTLPCNLGSVSAGSPANDVIVIVTATIDGAGAFSNTASVSASEVDNNPANDIDDGSDGNNDGIAIGEANLVTVKTLLSSDTTPSEGAVVTYIITVNNNGPDDATNVVLEDTIPVQLTATSNNGLTGGDQPSTYVEPNWTIPLIESGQFVTLIIEGTVNLGEDGNTITNITTAAITADQTDPTTAGDDLNESVTVDGCIDTDGDGDCDSTDPDPADPCNFTPGSIADPTNSIWASADCDGDGDPNGSDPNPNNPCEFTAGTTAPSDPMMPGTPAQTAYDIWAAEDCDGDGVTNGQEVIDMTDPYDECEYLPVNQDYTTTTAQFQDEDCDGDGVTNANEIDPDGNGVDDGNGTDPFDPCDYEPLLVTEAQTGAWILADCDGDGDPNGSDPDPTDPCEFSSGTTTPSDPAMPGTPEQTAYDFWAAADCDGDGTLNGNDTEPYNPCVDDGTIGDEDTTNAIWQAADCDGDGETNGTENNNGSDPNNPCSVSGVSTIPATTDPNYSVWASADCDGDGETNGEEVVNGTDPFDPCSVTNPTTPLSTDPNYSVWASADCDGDGTPNGTDPSPYDPCVDDGTTGDEDTTNAIWQAADCDGDGTLNGTDPSPYDPCVDDGTTGDEDTANAIWQAADCDGDGTANGTDPSPYDPCVDDGTTGDEDTANAIWQAADCDGDGETNGQEIANGTDPYDPCSNSSSTVPDPNDANYSVWASADCDGDGETNGEEVVNGTDPFDPCSVTNPTTPLSTDPNYSVWASADCDGDGTANGTDPSPYDPCVDDGTIGDEDTTNAIWQAADCDGDGTANGTDPSPYDPCVDDGTTGDEDTTNAIWQAADCDGDGVLNSDEISNGTDPNDPCDYNVSDV
ncbi:Ig-like domain-containing protein, partial [Olleya sp. ITB9]|uniref:Ig-like domain-containing protein n=1 Tax=Olleya sp. ITB9 TaxID=1715648 RepID=UPI0011DF46E1